MDYTLFEIEALQDFDKVIERFKNNLNKISTGRANSAILNGIKVMYYEQLTPLNELAQINIPEPRQILIKPFEISYSKDISVAINSASLGINAINEGHQVRITLPELTTQRRKELVKLITDFTEQAKVQIRTIRQDINKEIKADKKLPEDESKKYLDQIQKNVDKYNHIIDQLTTEKENELMNF